MSSSLDDSLRRFDVSAFGAAANGVVECTEHIVRALSAAAAFATSSSIERAPTPHHHARPRAVVRFAAGGTFLTMPFNVSSYVALEVRAPAASCPLAAWQLISLGACL